MFSIDLPVFNEWSSVDLLRTSVENCCRAMFTDFDCRYAIAMVTGELLENAIKYGDWSQPGRSFRLRVWGEGNRAYVSVENPVRPDDANADEVIETLRWMDQFPSVDEAYRARLLEVAANLSRGDSKLGLVRIAYEGRCRLRAEREGAVLRIIGELQVDGGYPETPALEIEAGPQHSGKP